MEFDIEGMSRGRARNVAGMNSMYDLEGVYSANSAWVMEGSGMRREEERSKG